MLSLARGNEKNYASKEVVIAGELVRLNEHGWLMHDRHYASVGEAELEHVMAKHVLDRAAASSADSRSTYTAAIATSLFGGVVVGALGNLLGPTEVAVSAGAAAFFAFCLGALWFAARTMGRYDLAREAARAVLASRERSLIEARAVEAKTP